MQFAHTWQKVLSGEKTQTRRIQKPGDSGWGYVERNGRTIYEAGRTYAVQPGRAKKAIARIRITSIRREDVRAISGPDVKAEGFASWHDFMLTWCEMHDKQAFSGIYEDELELPYVCSQRPADRYQAWVIEFKLLPETVTA